MVAMILYVLYRSTVVYLFVVLAAVTKASFLKHAVERNFVAASVTSWLSPLQVSACGGHMLRGRVAYIPGIPSTFIMVARPVRVQLGSVSVSHSEIAETDFSMSYPFASEERNYDAFFRGVLLDLGDVPHIEAAKTKKDFLDESMVILQASDQLPVLTFEKRGSQFLGVQEAISAILGTLILDE